MASRQEEKEARRQARLEQEAAEARTAARKQRLWMVVGGLGALAVIAVVVLVLTGGSGGSGNETEAKSASASGVSIPAAKITDEKQAAKVAGCDLNNPPDEGRGHADKKFTASDYKTNPPTSGTHYPQWAQDGIYTAKTVPDNLGMLVHPLEHGRIEVQYQPDTDATTVKRLEGLVAEMDDGYHMLMFPNTTDMPYAVAATAWDHSLTCKSMNDEVFDAIRTFRDAHIDRGPEKID